MGILEGRTRNRASQWRVGLVALVTIVLVALAGIAFADGPDHYIDLTQDGAEDSDSGVLFRQGGIGAGTGNFDPFVTASPGGSTPTEQAINNVKAKKQWDTAYAGADKKTHSLSAAAVPAIDVGGTLYREFHLDSNDSGADPYMSVDNIIIMLDTEKTNGGFDPNTRVFSDDNDVPAHLLYELDGSADHVILANTQGLESGSGVSDMSILIPDDWFPDACDYGNPLCDEWIYFYFSAGGYDGSLGVPLGLEDANWDTTAGFEEWNTELLPVVNISKTAEATYTLEYDWTVSKTVSDDALHLFAGESDSVDWTVDWTRDDGTTSNELITGTVTVLNPTGGFPIAQPIATDVQTITDQINLGGSDIPLTLSCDAALPTTLGAGDTINCTYSHAPGATLDGVNTAEVEIQYDNGDKKNPVTSTVTYGATADVVFPAIPTSVLDDTASLSDDRAVSTLPGTAGNDGNATYPETFECNADEGPHSNTAILVEDDTGQTHNSAASLNVNCYNIAVSKTANTSFDREWDWTIEKQVADGANQTSGFVELVTLDLFSGQSGDVTWKLTADRGDPFDSGHAVAGVITITNPAPMIASNVSVTDLLPSGSPATVVCPGGVTTVNVPAHDGTNPGSETCTYGASTADGGTNTATATHFGIGYDGTALVSFADDDATITKIDETAKWEDLTQVSSVAVLDGETTTYNETFACDADEGGRTNTARIDEDTTNDFDENSAAVDVNCYNIAVSKTANTSFDRDWDWTIDKSGSTDSVTLNFGESATVGYTVTVHASKIDSNHAVAGVITVTNNAPIAAPAISVADVVPGGTAVIDCGGSTTIESIAASGSAQCTYTASTDGSDGTNTATATLFGIDYFGTAAVDFSAATINETDASVDVSDSLQGFLGTVTAPTPTAGVVFSYSRIVESTIQGCGDTSIPNVASLATDDGQTLADNWNVDVTVICTRSQLTPTGTECVDFASDTATDLEILWYHDGLGSDPIGAVNPGAFIYWAEIIHGGGDLDLDVLQSVAGIAKIDLASDGPKLFDAACSRVQGIHFTATGGDVTISKNNLAAGTYYITVKYNPQSLSGETPAGGTFVYSWGTSQNGSAITNEDSLELKPY